MNSLSEWTSLVEFSRKLLLICFAGGRNFLGRCLKTSGFFALKAHQDGSQWQDRCKRSPPLVRTSNDPRPEILCAPSGRVQITLRVPDVSHLATILLPRSGSRAFPNCFCYLTAVFSIRANSREFVAQIKLLINYLSRYENY